MILLIYEITACVLAVLGISLLIAMEYAKLMRFRAQSKIQTYSAKHACWITPGRAIYDLERYDRKIGVYCIASVISLLLSIVLLIIYAQYTNIAVAHGSYDNVHNYQTISEIKECDRYGYIESKLPNNTSDCIIIFFKYGCDDCAVIHDDLMAYIADIKYPVYFVSSRSDIGKPMIDKYDVPEVPAVTVVLSDDFVTKKLCTSDKTFDKDNFDIVLEYLSDNKKGVLP